MTTNSLSEQWSAQPIGRIAAPLREQVVESLRQAILEYKLKPGQRLIERELVEQLGVSRTTVREAIRDLNSQGLVTVVPQKGAIVSAPTRDDALDFYEVRAQIESLLVSRFVERAADEDAERLLAAVDHIQRVVSRTTDVREILSAKEEFYEALFHGARSSAMRQALDSIRNRVQHLRSLSLAVDGRPQEMAAELRAVAEAADRRDADRASTLMAVHVRAAARAALGS